jgi:putative ATP-dependent endonuclease of OLD family
VIAIFLSTDLFNTRSHLHVCINEKTLEHELFIGGNADLLRNAFLALHPNSEKDWKNNIIDAPSEAEQADAFLELLKSKRTRKGDLAQQLALRISKRAPCFVPKYLRDAIEAISAQ